jgi:hypothetical protein
VSSRRQEDGRLQENPSTDPLPKSIGKDSIARVLWPARLAHFAHMPAVLRHHPDTGSDIFRRYTWMKTSWDMKFSKV